MKRYKGEHLIVGNEMIIYGIPQDGFDEHGNSIHNCDEMGCPSPALGPHIIARFPIPEDILTQMLLTEVTLTW